MAGAILLRLPRFQTMRRIFRGRRSTLKTSDVILRGRRSTLDVACCVFSANRIVSAEVAVPIMGKVAKRVFFDVSQDVVMSFCVAGVALCAIPRV